MSGERDDLPPTLEGGDDGTVSRRSVLRGSAALAVTAWTVPTIVTFRPDPAHAVSPVPGEQPGAEGEVKPRIARADRQEQELAVTGLGLGWLGALGAGAVATGATVLRRSRQRGVEQPSPGPDDG